MNATDLFYYIGFFYAALWTADFITGFFHWVEDTYCLDKYPIVGELACSHNLDHHIDSQLMVRTGTFISRNYLQWLLAVIAITFYTFMGWANPFTITVTILASFGNEVHRWNHMSKTSKFVSFMKNTGVIQNQKQHSLHHKKPYIQNYCILTSQVNPILETVNFWRNLEKLIQLVLRISPKRENRRDA